MFQNIIDKLYSRFIEVVSASRKKLLSEDEIRALADGRVLVSSEALKTGLVDSVAYLDESITSLKKDLKIEHARVVTYGRPKSFKSNIYSEYPAVPLIGSQMNLISITAEELSPFSGLHFMYLWNP